MLRKFLWMACACVFVLALAQFGFAQDGTWPPATNVQTGGEHALDRGPGFYLAAWKLILMWIVFLFWVWTTDWVSRDSREVGAGIGMPYSVWNPVAVFSFLAIFLLATINIPIFLAGFPLAVVAWGLPLIIYIVQRNGKVTEERRVLTADHLKRWFANLGKKKKQDEGIQMNPWQMGPQVEMIPVGSDSGRNQTLLIESRQIAPVFVSTKYLMADALDNRAEKMMLDFTADAVAIRYYVDGVWHAANPKVTEQLIDKKTGKPMLDRALGDGMLAVLKKIAGLNVADRRTRQEGKIKFEYAGSKYDGILQSQGTPTGERVVLLLMVITKTQKSLQDLGMRDKLREQLQGLLANGQKGLVLFSAMPGDGLTAMWVAALRSTDRLLRDFVAIQDVGKQEPEVENVELVKFNPEAGEVAETPLPKLLLRMPEVICIPNIVSGPALGVLCDQANDNEKLNIISLRGKDAIDAIYRAIALQPELEEFANALTGVVYVRLLRKLCESCREPFAPTPDLLQRLGIPAGRIDYLYREKQPLPPGTPPPPKKKGEPEVCPSCRGIGYKGKIGLFEMIQIDDGMRAGIKQKVAPEVLRNLSRKAGNRTLQEEGILLVASGVTSLDEMKRILKPQ